MAKRTLYDPYADYTPASPLNNYNGAGKYAAYQAQVTENKKIANTPEATPGFGLYAQPVAASPYNAPASTPAVTPEQAIASGQVKIPTAMPTSPYAGYSSPYEKQAQTPVADPFLYAKYTAPKTETAAVAGSASAPKTEVKKEAGVASSAGSVGATESEYDKYYRENYGAREKQIEADYQRSLANYGVKAETLAQMGIHGGMSDYVNASAYAQLQERKAEIGKEARQGYAAYLQNKEANSAVVGNIYSYLTGSGYEDEDGNMVQGVNLTAIQNDEDYATAKAMYKQDLIGRGASEADIDAALARVDSMRQMSQQQIQNAMRKSFEESDKNGTGVDQDKLLTEVFGYNVQQGYDLNGNAIEESDEDFESRKGQYVLQSLDTAVENGWITPEQRSATIKEGLPMYSAAYSQYKTNDIEGKGKKLSDSVLSAVVMHDQRKITDADFKQILADAEERIKAEGVTLKYEKRPGWDNIEVKIGSTETIHSDNFGNVTPAKEEELNKRFGNEASVNEKGIIAIDFDGSTTKDDDGKLQYNYTLYYREGENARWQKLRTKEGSVSDTNGGARTGDNWLAVLAVLEQYNKDTPSDFATFYKGTENKPTSGQYAAYELSKKTTAPNAANRQFETAYPSYAKFGK